MIEIGKLFNIEKGSLQSSKCTPGQYSFITAGEEWKTHIEYTHDCEALVFAMAASGSLGRTHYVNGKFIASDLCFILTPKKEYVSKVNLRFYSFYFNTYRERIVKATATGTSKLAINRKSFSNYQIYLVDIEKQTQLLHKLDKMKSISDGLLQTIQQQQKYAEMLRQSILQQEVEGKLCEQDPNDEPASVLLEKIKAEKERLIAEKKIKKQKPLPPISEEEKTFDLPKGWEWCRLGELVTSVTDGPHYSPEYHDKGIPFISGRNITLKGIDFSTAKFISPQLHEELSKRCRPETGDILYTKGGETGKAVVNDIDFEFNVWVHVAVLKPSTFVYNKYLALALNSPHCYALSQKYTHGTGNRDLGLTRMIKITVPLPPANEQQRIVQRVTKLMG